MKRTLTILLLGLALASMSYGVLVGNRTVAIRDLEERCGPDLAWIKTEFKLDAATVGRVRALHEAYLPVCEEYCRQIDAEHARLAELMADSATFTPEMTELLTRANALRARCQEEMLKYFFEVSRVMSPEEGQRFLQWTREATIVPSHHAMVPQMAASNHDTHLH